MKTTQPLKYTLVATTTALLMLSMTVLAAPFTPGQTLDPGCNPGTADCYVSAPSGGSDTDWTQNGAGVWNTDDNIGIGTNAPGMKLSIQNNNPVTSSFATQASFSGTGLDDLTTNLIYTGSEQVTWRLVIASTGSPDTIDIYRNGILVAPSQPVPAGTFPLTDGTELSFGSNTGHSIGDSWSFTQVPEGAFISFDSGFSSFSLTESRAEILQDASQLTLYSIGDLSPVDQYLKLEANIADGNYIGYEVQGDGAGGGLKAKMYFANPTTNVSVIEVGEEDVQITTNAFNETTYFNENGVVFPNLAAEPAGQNGAIYYNTSTSKMRVFENGAWVDLI